MKTIKNFFLTLAAITCFTACEKDGEKIYLNSLEPGDLIASENTVMLTQKIVSKLCYHWHGQKMP